MLLNDCSDYLREEKGITTTCRIAGGWVRDKLLGSDSQDIDIALSDMMGLTFAEHLAEFARTKGVKTGTISRIAQNPDQSKHLETATFRFLGLDIDLVNLRSEEYANNSRIPTGVAFGTPREDALRRDATINALFYNIHERCVEDFTGKGLDDLRDGIIRTPLPPKETFQDDPLRVLRCVRFASRFGFDIVLEVQEAAKDLTIQEALVSKVARERVGEEVSKMMKGRNPLCAIKFINDLSLYHSIFSVIPSDISATFSATPGSAHDSLVAASILHALLHPVHSLPLPTLHPTLLSAVKADPSCKARLYLATNLTPYKNISYSDKKKKIHSAIDFVVRESLKLGTQNHYLDGIPALFAAAQLLKDRTLNVENHQKPSERVAIGLLLRDKAIHNANTGTHWTTSFLFSLVQELVPHYDVLHDKLDASVAASLIELYNMFVARIEELGLPDTLQTKPILDGREVINALGADRPGAWTGRVMAKILEWQLENPQGTKETCISWLKQEQHDGRLELDNVIAEPSSKRARTKR